MRRARGERRRTCQGEGVTVKEEVPDSQPLASEQLSALLETLRKIAEMATGGASVDMELLRWTIEDAVQWYEIDPWVEAEVNKMNVHEVVGPARVVLAILRNEANGGVVFDALGDGDFFEGIRRRNALIADLERLEARAAQHTPPKRPNNRPPRTDLRLLVGHLANGWLLLTNTRFSSDWNKGTRRFGSATLLKASRSPTLI